MFEKDGSNEVLVLSMLKLRARATGQALDMPLTQVFKVDRQKEVITEIRPFYWTAKGVHKAVQT